jgi:hypothetical protein
MTVAREGTREITIATVVCALIELPFLFLAIKYSLWFLAAGLPIWGLWLFVVLFFRDPNRNIPSEPGILVSPADGKVTEVSRLDRYDGIKGRALRISIFLSVFDVHINRVPCAGRVRKIEYKPGKFLDARHPDCSSLNESNTIEMDPGRGAARPDHREAGGRAHCSPHHLQPERAGLGDARTAAGADKVWVTDRFDRARHGGP